MGKTGKKILVEQLKCERCKKTWWPKIDTKTDTLIIPVVCAKCNSPYWNTPKRTKK